MTRPDVMEYTLVKTKTQKIGKAGGNIIKDDSTQVVLHGLV